MERKLLNPYGAEMIEQQKGFKGTEQGALYELPGGWVWMKLVDAMDREFGEPQINADERRFVGCNLEHLSGVFSRKYCVNSPQSSQRTQSTAILAILFENVQQQRIKTRITRFRQIFTDNQRASASSAQSMFHSNPSAFICG
jgi:hypothetical protein